MCEKRVSRTLIEVKKENLVCSCHDLKRDTLLIRKLAAVEKRPVRYFIGAVVTKSKKGIYQYIDTGSRNYNEFMYYNGNTVYILNDANLSAFADSLSAIGISKNKIDKMIPRIRKSMAVDFGNTSDSF